MLIFNIVQLCLYLLCPTAVAFYYVLTLIFVWVVCPLAFLFLLYSRFYPILLLYIIWYIYDLNTCNQGGRRWKWLRTLKVWTYLCEYFPIRMVKTCDLPPTKNYIMCYHPHGIIAVGAVTCFGTEATNFQTEFPGLISRVLTLRIQFHVPFHRELVLGAGFCSVAKESIDWILSKEGTGNASCIVIGGALETLEAHPNTANLVLKNRKGFVKLALKHGACLVPVFAFGENNIFRQIPNPDGSFIRKLQNSIKKNIRVPTPFFYGIFGSILPFRKPITVVIGRPIDLKQEIEPSQTRVDEVHELYISELKKLVETHKVKYDPNLKLNII